MIGPGTAIRNFFVDSFNFSGRSSRAEFWWIFVISLGLFVVAGILDMQFFDTLDWADTYAYWPVSDTLTILLTIPLASLGCRRMHDIGVTGIPAIIFQFGSAIWMISLIGKPVSENTTPLEIAIYGTAVLLLILALIPSKPEPNKYGPNPNEVMS